jgi:hypothetical protein
MVHIEDLLLFSLIPSHLSSYPHTHKLWIGTLTTSPFGILGHLVQDIILHIVFFSFFSPSITFFHLSISILFYKQFFFPPFFLSFFLQFLFILPLFVYSPSPPFIFLNLYVFLMFLFILLFFGLYLLSSFLGL